MTLKPHLTRYVTHDVTLLGDTRRPGGVTLAFTERTGGCSAAPYASLNLGDHVGDDPQAVDENRRRVLAALGCGSLAGRLVCPRQVHGSEVLVVTDGSDEAVHRSQAAALEGYDAVVCTAADVPVLLVYADCVPVILVAEGAFAVIHSGRPGCGLRICAKALDALCEAASCNPSDVIAYVGPHVAGEDYEVSAEMADDFARLFGDDVVDETRHLDLGKVVRRTLVESGVCEERIFDDTPSTASTTDRFFSYRAEGNPCGRHGALACLRTSAKEVPAMDEEGHDQVDYDDFVSERRAQILEQVRAAAQTAGRDPSEVLLLAVSKTVGMDEVESAYRAGYRVFGENRPQELRRKATGIAERPGMEDVRLDMIGNLQTNKINQVIGCAHLVHSVSSLHLAEAISRRACAQERIVRILLEVNVSGEASKSGFSQALVREQLDEILALPGLSLEGVMTMAPAHDPSAARRTFSGLRDLRDELRIRSGLPLDTLSCGMSDDFGIAVEEGSTLIRLGRIVFDPAYALDV